MPADNVVIEPELAEVPLDGISFHVARIPTTVREEMPVRGIEAARIFVEIDCRAIVYACAESSFLGGLDACCRRGWSPRGIEQGKGSAGQPRRVAQ